MALMPLSVKLIMSTDLIQHLFKHHQANPHLASHLSRFGSHPVLSSALFGAYKNIVSKKEAAGKKNAADIAVGASSEETK